MFLYLQLKTAEPVWFGGVDYISHITSETPCDSSYFSYSIPS